MAHKLQIKRVYEAEAPDDGYRILVDRLWPRGMSKVRADLSDWDKSVAPSAALRKSFHDGEIPYAAFREAYDKELAANPAYDELVGIVREKLQGSNVTLLFASKDETENNAEVLLELLRASLGGSASQGQAPETQQDT